MSTAGNRKHDDIVKHPKDPSCSDERSEDLAPHGDLGAGPHQQQFGRRIVKLASLKNGRDGRLLVVSQDLRRAVLADDVAPTLQAALDDWGHSEPALRDLATRLEAGTAKDHPFDPAACASPLPRAYQWADGSAYVNHVALVRQARGAEMPPSFWTDPLMYQGGSDSFLSPGDPIYIGDPSWGGDFESEVAVIVGEVPQGATIEQARAAIRLVMLVNDVSLRGLIPAELAKGFGFFQSKPSSAFSPVAATPDSLGEAWDGGKLNLPLLTHLNGALFGKPNAGIDMTFDFPTLIAHAAKTRPLAAGSIIGSGTVPGGRSRRAASAIPAWPKCGWSRPSSKESRRRRSCRRAIASISR
jgi:fumarylacetoacetate (FAA) hydrolase